MTTYDHAKRIITKSTFDFFEFVPATKINQFIPSAGS